MVRNHKVLYVDLLGTCFDILTKPLPLMQRHVDIYRHKVIMGLHNKQKKVKELTNGGGTSTSKNNLTSSKQNFLAASSSQGFEEENDINMEIPIDDPSQVVLHKEMFLECNSTNRDVFFHEDHLDFAFTEYGRASESKTVTFSNKFNFEVEVNWEILSCLTSMGNVVDNCYSVEPSKATVQAGASAEFRVKFKPYEPDAYFF